MRISHTRTLEPIQPAKKWYSENRVQFFPVILHPNRQMPSQLSPTQHKDKHDIHQSFPRSGRLPVIRLWSTTVDYHHQEGFQWNGKLGLRSFLFKDSKTEILNRQITFQTCLLVAII